MQEWWALGSALVTLPAWGLCALLMVPPLHCASLNVDWVEWTRHTGSVDTLIFQSMLKYQAALYLSILEKPLPKPSLRSGRMFICTKCLPSPHFLWFQHVYIFWLDGIDMLSTQAGKFIKHRTQLGTPSPPSSHSLTSWSECYHSWEGCQEPSLLYGHLNCWFWSWLSFSFVGLKRLRTQWTGWQQKRG